MGYKTHHGYSRRIAVLIAILSMLLSSCSQQTKPDPHPRTVGPMTPIEQAFKEENYAKARMMLEPLARQGNADAQYALGYLHYYGLGKPRDEQTAWQWFRAAARQNHAKAVTALKMLESQRKVEEQAQELIDTRTQTPASPSSKTTPAPAPVAAMPTNQSEPAQVPRVQPMPTPVAEPVPGQQAVTPEIEPEQIAGQSWLKSRPAHHFTIQLISVSREPAAQKFMQTHDLHTEAAYFEHTVGGKPVYAVVVGDFASRDEAKSHYQTLPSKLRRHQPWIRQFGDIQRNP